VIHVTRGLGGWRSQNMNVLASPLGLIDSPHLLCLKEWQMYDFGAKRNDDGDDTQAFEKAWNAACSTGSVLLVPENNFYYLKPITYSGPCKPNTAFTIRGTIIAWHDMSAYENTGKSGLKYWIMFDGITNLRVDGGGLIDGNNKKWWMNSCKINKNLIIDTIFRDQKNTPCRTCRIRCLLKCLGFARNIRYMNIEMRNVSNPIFIDQNYCDQSTPCPEQGSAVELSDVRYQNIKGTSASEVAIKLHSSKSVPCKGLYMQDVVLTPVDGGDIEASCENVEYVNRGKFYPQCVPA
ncbi:polygalacturonase-like, partial [Gastrolobium bilobum]|uniref:polygalacturonase-like n=1 Tax=Gastrolobium bilobum TaxID=150636 RepID=UPI002AB169B9